MKTSESEFYLPIIHNLLAGHTLSRKEARVFFSAVVRGEVPDILLAAAISAIKVRTQTVEELVGAATALLDSATPFDSPAYEVADIVGTGGDGHNTINLSTIAAITAAACGARIIKHGNRSISSVSGSFDFLEKLGVDFNLSPGDSWKQANTHGLCFLFAPNYHAGMRHAANVRKTLKARTIFNLLGPLVNPARPQKMLLGVADPNLVDPIAQVLQQMECESAFVVHGSGVDEVAIHGSTMVAALKNGKIERMEVTPADFGSETFELQELVCHDPVESHERSKGVLSGRGSDAENSAVSVNVAMLLNLFGHDDLKNNFFTSMESLAAGKPMQLVTKMAEAD